METNIKFNYPSSEKVYLSGKLYPEIKVGMRICGVTVLNPSDLIILSISNGICTVCRSVLLISKR